MRIKEISIAASALAMLGIVAPVITQTVDAADKSSALSGTTKGYTQNYSGATIINNSASAYNGDSGSASGQSLAGIAFKSGDLILYQVPNFDFGIDNPISIGRFNLIKAAGVNSTDISDRQAVIVDNRYTEAENTAGRDYNWQLNAEVASNFIDRDDTNSVPKELNKGSDINLIIYPNTNFGKKDASNNWKKAHFAHSATTVDSANDPNSPDDLKLYLPGSEITNYAKRLKFSFVNNDPASSPAADYYKNDGVDISQGSKEIVRTIQGDKDDPQHPGTNLPNSNINPGAVGINFTDVDSAVLVTTKSALTKIIPKHHYTADIQWTLTTSPILGTSSSSNP